MKAAYYVRLLPNRILVMRDRDFLIRIAREHRKEWHRIEAWNRYHAKVIGLEMRKCIEVLTS